MTNATERLRALLDERGVEWEGTPGITFWGNCSALDITTNEKEKVHLHLCCTPEQAIAATLGRGTCENIAQRYLDFLCSECGFVHYIDDANCTGDGNEWDYCPRCGCEVER